MTEINKLTHGCNWRYCPTDSNPADLISRGTTAAKFNKCDLWMKGPEWLVDTDKWPNWKTDEAFVSSTFTEDNIKCKTQTKRTQEGDISTIMDIDRYGSYQKLLRITAYVFRFIHNLKTDDTHNGNLSVTEVQTASIAWIRSSQLRNYPDVLESLEQKTLNVNLVKQLKLYLDEKGLIRCGGRIRNAPISASAKYPILLPNKDKLTNLIVLDAHTRLLHSGLESTVTSLRQFYWIPAIRQCVKTLLRKCISCKKVIGRPYATPDPPPLPADRLKDSPPFTVTGVDFTGALHIKSKNGQGEKVYICLFTCANTRAVHLEIVEDLSEQTFILAFRRFTSRKSLPKIMVSDNATTYVAAAKEIEFLTKSPTLQEKLNSYGTTWKFIPKRAPWYGGFWERLIGLTKNCIKKVLGKAFVSLQVLETVVTEVEAILNDRPLTYVSSDPTDYEPLTPSNLLYGRRIKTLPYTGTIDDKNEHSVKDLTHSSMNKLSQIQSRIIQNFQTRWKREYLTSLRERDRNHGVDKQNIKVGEVVQIYNENSRTTWNIAIIEKLVEGKDGFSRSAILRTKNGLTSRPICKLYPLELTADENTESHDELRTARRAKTDAKEKIKMWTNSNN